MRVSRGWRDRREDAGGDFGGAAGDAGLAATTESNARYGRVVWDFFEIYLKRGHLKVAATGLVDEIDDRAFVAVKETDELAEIRGSDIVVNGVKVAVIG